MSSDSGTTTKWEVRWIEGTVERLSDVVEAPAGTMPGEIEQHLAGKVGEMVPRVFNALPDHTPPTIMLFRNANGNLQTVDSRECPEAEIHPK